MLQDRARSGTQRPGLNYPRGKVLGGTSQINAMVYMRGQAADYDGWRQLGLKLGLGRCTAAFRAHEDHFRGANEHHGAGGEWRVDKPRVQVGNPRRLH